MALPESGVPSLAKKAHLDAKHGPQGGRKSAGGASSSTTDSKMK